MRRPTLNFIIDVLGFIFLVCLAVTGVIMKYVLLPGTGGRGREISGGRGREHIETFISLSRHQWGDIHFWFSLGFVAIVLIHVILHYKWLKGYIKSLFKG